MAADRVAWPAGRLPAGSNCLHTFCMGNEHHDGGGGDAEQPDAYWRRRVITLALGLGLLGILAWGFSGGGGKPTQSSPGPLTATALGTAIPGLAGSSPAASVGSPSPSVSGASPSASKSPGGRPQASASPVASGTATPVQGRCAPGSVVLSLFTDRSGYTSGELPQFQVYAVSTSASGCSFDPRQLQVAVMSSGRIVWDSADCSRVAGRPLELARGVPAQAAFTWDRSITLPGCQVLASSARAGSYTVQARTASVQSPVRTFRIAG